MRGQRQTRRIVAGLFAAACLGQLGVLSIGVVRTARTELVLGQAWEAVETSDWDAVLALTDPILAADAPGRRAAELHCYALLATGERDRCAELLDRVLVGPAEPLPEPMLVRLAVHRRQQEGRVPEAAALARAATVAHPDDPMLLGLEIATRAALGREETVLADLEQRLASGTGAGDGLRLALARRRSDRGEWDLAIALLASELPEDAELAVGWLEERVRAQAGRGDLTAVRETFALWAARGGDPVELAARHALTLSYAQLPDPEASWVALLEAALARANERTEPRLVRQLHERLIAHHLADERHDAALAALGRAERAGVERLAITREQIERGAALHAAGGDPSRVAPGVLAFRIPEALGRGALAVSDHASREPDAAYEEILVEGGDRVEIARGAAAWPERWVLRDAEGGVRASGSVWSIAAARSEVAIELAAPAGVAGASPATAAQSGVAHRAASDGRSRVFAVVLDCADWRLVQYLRARGELPVLERFFAQGHRAVLRSDPPLTAAAMESLVWPHRGRATSVAGVVHQLGVELAGLASVGDNPFGFLAPLLPEGESLFEVVGAGPRVAANMLFAHGGIAAGRHAEMVGPDGLRRRVATARTRRPLRPEERLRFAGLDSDPQATGHVEAIAAELDAAIELAEAGEVDLLVLRLESLDILTHALYSELASTRQDDGVSTLLAAYRYIDARLGALDAALDADDVLVTMSDHGIRSAMEHEEDAVFVAVGGGIAPGRAEGRPDLRGVAHTLAALTGVDTAWPTTGVAAWLESPGVVTAAAGSAHRH